VATDCAPHPGRAARPGRNLAGMGDAAVTDQFGHRLLDAVMGPALNERLMWLSPDR
jgi:hypothetical protein